jgi:hydroxymethylpyrimidine/phosphomethylpyrimidine kinase
VQNQSSPLVLSFGATDPVGAIGIQADLASFAAMGCHGLSVVTAILTGDSAGIEAIQVLDAEWIDDQARILLEDMPVAAFKVGFVGSIENASVIAEIVSDYPDIPLILDPFASAMPDQGQEGEELLHAIRELLVPQSTLLSISSVELARFGETWRETSVEDSLPLDVVQITGSGCEYLLVTSIPSGSHELINTLFNQAGVVRSDTWPRLPGPFLGAGATLSGTIAALLANGLDIPEAVLEAQEFSAAALAHAHRPGMGKLIPDRYFWARDPDENSQPDQQSI